jgi:GTP cyclohydrolase II
MNTEASRTILEVERAISDVRRGIAVILIEQGQPNRLVLSGEHHPSLPANKKPDSPSVQLMKLAGLLPTAVEQPLSASMDSLLSVSAEAITAYPASLALTLEKVSEAIVPLPESETARFIAFRPRFGHEEHLAIVIGNPSTVEAPLVRLHSSCVTGDIFASLRCDCGTQLHKALRMIAEEGTGAVLYLSQEGRGIGIANKLRAYALQDSGMDTVEANLALGFEADERDFAIAATMLKMLGMPRITLLTNNPLKQNALAQHGIDIAGRRAVTTKPTRQNNAYLNTKASKMGHTFKPSPCNSDL